MSCIYIDLGGYQADTVREFLNWSKLTYGEQDWQIYVFEPNPDLKPYYKKYNVIYSDKAAWTSDGEAEFALDQTDTPMGSTLMSSKTAIWDKFPKIKVQTFDFSQWLIQFAGDTVVVKMDIEGAEFPILEKMIAEGTIHIPDKLCVEFHPNKVKDYTSTYMQDLISRAGREIILWH